MLQNNSQVIQFPAESDQAWQNWVALTLTLLLLVGAALFARWPSRRQASHSAPRWLRILAVAIAFAGAITALLVFEQIWFRNSAEQVAVRTILAFASLLVIGLIFSAIADFWLGLFRPHRSRNWLPIAIGSFVLFVALYLILIALIDGTTLDMTVPEMLQAAAIALVTALSWWSLLPPARKEVSRVFD